VTVTSARTNANIPRIGARQPLLGNLALGAQHGKLDADLRTYALLGTPSVQSISTTIPLLWRMGADWRLWWLSWLIASLFWWQFVASRSWVLLTLVVCALTTMSNYVQLCNILFVELLM
jgi:hypothetical protein